jgi:hypothetical protein
VEAVDSTSQEMEGLVLLFVFKAQKYLVVAHIDYFQSMFSFLHDTKIDAELIESVSRE